MIRFDHTTVPEIERGYKDIKQACFHDSSHSRLFGNPEDMNAFKYWTQGIRKAADEASVRIWNGRRHVKINGQFTPYTHRFYRSFIRPIPPGYNGISFGLRQAEWREKKLLDNPPRQKLRQAG